jgi:hypothetical protein
VHDSDYVSVYDHVQDHGHGYGHGDVIHRRASGFWLRIRTRGPKPEV